MTAVRKGSAKELCHAGLETEPCHAALEMDKWYARVRRRRCSSEWTVISVGHKN